jgi:hypothetical protein
MKTEREGKHMRIHIWPETISDMVHFQVLSIRTEITNAFNSVEEVVLKNKNTWTHDNTGKKKE